MGQGQSSPNVAFPQDLDDLKEHLRYARVRGYQVCLVGSGMSQNEQNIGSPQILMLKLDKLNQVTIHPGRKVAIVRGNVTFRGMEVEANKFGLTTITRQASGIFGILSSIATNVHGWDHHAGSIMNTVNWVRVLDSNGRELIVRPRTPQFKACVGSYGGSYLMFEVEIQLTKNVMLRKEPTSFQKFQDALADFKTRSPEADLGLIWVGKSRYHSILFNPISRDAQVSSNLKFEGMFGDYWCRLYVDISRFILWLGLKWFLDIIYEWWVEEVWTKVETKLRNEFMNVPINAINRKGLISRHEFWLVEYFVKEEDLEDLLALYREEFKNVFTFNTTIRFVPKCTASSTPYARTDVYALVICWDQIVTDGEIRQSDQRNQRFLEFLRERQGMFYLPYRNDPDDAIEFYPEFAAKIHRRQPSLFSNVMIEKIRARGPRGPPATDPETLRSLNTFVQTGSCDLTCSNLPELITAAEHYDRPDLVDACFLHATQFLRIDAVCGMLMSLEKYYQRYASAAKLLDIILEFVEPQAYQLFACADFLSLSESIVQMVMSRDLEVSEIHKFMAMEAWATHKVQNSPWNQRMDTELVVECKMERLGRDLKLDRISPQDLIGIVWPSTAIKKERILETLELQGNSIVPISPRPYFEALEPRRRRKPSGRGTPSKLIGLILVITILLFCKLLFQFVFEK